MVVTREKALEAVVVLALASLIIAEWRDLSAWVYVSISLLVIGVISKNVTLWLGKFWFGLSHYLAVVTNFVVMLVIYHLILVPLALLQRMTGSNHLKKNETGDSYFHKRDHLYSHKDVDRPW